MPAQPGFPLTITNGGQELTFEAPLKRAVTMDQVATEALLGPGACRFDIPAIDAIHDALTVNPGSPHPQRRDITAQPLNGHALCASPSGSQSTTRLPESRVKPA